MKIGFRMVSAAAIATALATPAFAQDTAPAQGTTATQPQEGAQGAAGADTAQRGGIEEIVVTAQKRAENVQDVPIAISAFTAAALQERAVSDVSQLSNLAPNVTLDAGTPFSGSGSVLAAYIRGIGSNDFAFNIDPGVGIYLDGVYLARTVGANQDLPDVERIEVLKGPQGTLFGRNTIGGAISIVTRDPGKTFRFSGDIMTGSYRLLQARGTVDVPLTDDISSSVTFSIKNRQGYVKRIPYPGSVGITDGFQSFVASGYDSGSREGGNNSYTTRGKIKWNNGGPLRLTLSGDYGRQNEEQIANTVLQTRQDVFAGWYNACINNTAASLAANGLGFLTGICSLPRASVNGQNTLPPLLGVNVDADPNNNRVPYDNRFLTGDKDKSYANGNDFSKLSMGGVSGVLDYDLGADIALKSITAYRWLNWKAGMDLDGSPLDMLHTSFKMDQKQFSQELQLLGTAIDSRLHYVLGGYYFKESGNLHDFVTFPAGFLQVDGPNHLKTENYAAFGQIDWLITDLIGITVGGRYTHENKEFEGGQSDDNGQGYKMLGLQPTEANRLLLCNDGDPSTPCFPNVGQPLRYYIAGLNHKKFNNFSPKVGIQLHPTEHVMVYGSYSQGYKTGGWTTRLSNPLPYAPDFNEEKAKTWEVGVKSELLDRHLQLNAAAFTTNYQGIQLNFQQGVSPVVQNAGNARIKGFEIETVIAPAGGLTINGSVGYIDSYYTSVDPAAQVAPSVDQVGVFKGASLPKTPKWKFNVSPRYELGLGNGGSIVLLGDYTHTTKLKNDTEGTYLLTRPSTDIINLSVSYREPSDHWELTVGGTNLTNERYLVTGQYQAAGGVVYGTYSRPAEWYARLAVKF